MLISHNSSLLTLHIHTVGWIEANSLNKNALKISLSSLWCTHFIQCESIVEISVTQSNWHTISIQNDLRAFLRDFFEYSVNKYVNYRKFNMTMMTWWHLLYVICQKIHILLLFGWINMKNSKIYRDLILSDVFLGEICIHISFL